MASAGDDDTDAVLSDVEGDDPVPIVINSTHGGDVSVERFREVVAELERERQAREAAEASKSELEVSFSRLKALARDGIMKRDEALREKEAALRSNVKITAELSEAERLRDEVARQFDEAVKAKESLKSEFETAVQMLVSGIEKISGKVVNIKNFSAGGLPRSQKYTGFPAVAYGVIKRTNEIVEELLKQLDATTKSRNEAREQVEQRNYEIAIEVSQLEATIGQLREEVSKKNSAVENLEKSVIEKDTKFSSMEKDMSEMLNAVENEASELRKLVDEYDVKLRNLEAKVESQRPLLFDQLNLVSKIHDQIYDAIKIVDINNLDEAGLSESLFLPQETDMEENIRACLAGMESIFELSCILAKKAKDSVEERSREEKSLNETISLLVKEKAHIGSLLRSALSRRMSVNSSSKTNELFQVAQNGLKEAGIDFKFAHLIEEDGPSGTEEDEIYALAGALENIIKTSQVEIIDLQHSVETLRAESSSLKEHVEAQTQELNNRKRRIEELEERDRVSNETIEGLMMNISALQEDVARWKVAAEQEAAAGKAVEQDFVAQLSAVQQELEEVKQSMTESEKKLRFKEETAAAAMAARDAAEKSLKLADTRASRLRDRLEELTRQLEESDTREDSRSRRNNPRYICWPWQWLGLNFVGHSLPDTQQQTSNEMELAEPLL